MWTANVKHFKLNSDFMQLVEVKLQYMLVFVYQQNRWEV